MILDLLAQQLQGDNLSQISRQLGADEKTTSSAISAALPILVGALARNSSRTSGTHPYGRTRQSEARGQHRHGRPQRPSCKENSNAPESKRLPAECRQCWTRTETAV